MDTKVKLLCLLKNMRATIFLVLLFSLLNKAPAEVTLVVRPVKLEYFQGEPVVIECAFINHGAFAEFLDTGFQGVHKFSFECNGQLYDKNCVFPGGGLDFGVRQVLVQPGQKRTVRLALNGWLPLKEGVHILTCTFKSKMFSVSAPFVLTMTKDRGDLKNALQFWYPYAQKLPSKARSDFSRTLSSVCVQDRETLDAFQHLSQKEELSEQEREFYKAVGWQAKQSWNAVD